MPNKVVNIDGKMIIEINEKNKDLKSLNFLTQNNLSEKENLRLENVAERCERFYEANYGEKEVTVKCLKCLCNSFFTNEILFFQDKKYLFLYVKYCFFKLENEIFFDHLIYVDNKYELEKCDNNYLKHWKFLSPKVICKFCFMQIINEKNLFSNLKNIFSDEDSFPKVRKLQKRKRKSKVKAYPNSFSNFNIENVQEPRLINQYNENVIVNDDYSLITINKSALSPDIVQEIEENNNNPNGTIFININSTNNANGNNYNYGNSSINSSFSKPRKGNSSVSSSKQEDENFDTSNPIEISQRTFSKYGPQFTSNELGITFFIIEEELLKKLRTLVDFFKKKRRTFMENNSFAWCESEISQIVKLELLIINAMKEHFSRVGRLMVFLQNFQTNPNVFSLYQEAWNCQQSQKEIFDQFNQKCSHVLALIFEIKKWKSYFGFNFYYPGYNIYPDK